MDNKSVEPGTPAGEALKPYQFAQLKCPRCNSPSLVKEHWYEDTLPVVACTSCGNLIFKTEFLPQIERANPYRSTVLDDFPEHARLLGRIAATSSRLEELIAFLAAFLMRTHFLSSKAALSSIASNAAKHRFLNSLVEYMPGRDEFSKPVIDLLSSCKKAYDARNKFIHANWQKKIDDALPYIIHAERAPMKAQFQQVSTTELIKVVDMHTELEALITQFMRDYGSAYPLDVPLNGISTDVLQRYGMQGA